MAQRSPFLEPGLTTSPNTLAIVSLSRDNFQPLILEKSTGAVDGYAEGTTLNTRFGSFPHSTLLNIPWGSQVRASLVDTGSRGRKRRREEIESDGTSTPSQDEGIGKPATNGLSKAVTASSGFVYVLRPSPELWTSSLPHRTQVVYTPDYSYILQRLRVRPGSRIIEAGAGSGSFTHASARAVYNGYPSNPTDKKGKVFSFEFHRPRFQKMMEEIGEHGLEDIVQLTHRDVYRDGFLVEGESPRAAAVFLDLPAPWEALRHLARRRVVNQTAEERQEPDWVSPLDPKQSTYICTFSPCIEQVTRTVTEMRSLGWTDVDMVQIAHQRINVLLERLGIHLPNERGFNSSPADVDEAVTKLKGDIRRTQDFHKTHPKAQAAGDSSGAQGDASADKMELISDDQSTVAQPSLARRKVAKTDDKPGFMQGRIVHRTEPDLKNHTSYLVFAILPREWDEEAEARALAKWPCGNEVRTIGNVEKEARKQEKRVAGIEEKEGRS